MSIAQKPNIVRTILSLLVVHRLIPMINLSVKQVSLLYPHVMSSNTANVSYVTMCLHTTPSVYLTSFHLLSPDYYVSVTVIPFVVSLLAHPLDITYKSSTRTSSIWCINHTISFTKVISRLVCGRCLCYI
jgi:hypothetical protein